MSGLWYLKSHSRCFSPECAFTEYRQQAFSEFSGQRRGKHRKVRKTKETFVKEGIPISLTPGSSLFFDFSFLFSVRITFAPSLSPAVICPLSIGSGKELPTRRFACIAAGPCPSGKLLPLYPNIFKSRQTPYISSFFPLTITTPAHTRIRAARFFRLNACPPSCRRRADKRTPMTGFINP